MKIQNLLKCIVVLLTINQSITAQTDEMKQVTSPDKKIVIKVLLQNDNIYYAVSKQNAAIVTNSKIGFIFKNMPALEKFGIEDAKFSSHSETWEQQWGEQRYVQNNYNELKVLLKEKAENGRKLNIIFRAFNDGIGFRYEFPSQPNVDSLIISDELTEFNLAETQSAWWIPVHSENSFYESLFRNTLVSSIDTANTPITIEMKNGSYIAIHEANLTDYASMTLRRKGINEFISELVPWSNGVKVYAKAPFSTPWRTIIIADKPGDLVTSRLMLNLNEPCVLKDISWIKPSKYIGIWWGMHLEKYTWGQGPKHGATTENVKKYLDFAASNGFDGVLVEGWNIGWDGKWYEDGTAFSFTKPYSDFDIEKICAYAALKKVKLIGHHETGGAATNYEHQMEDAFKLYNKYGVDAVKTGYVNKHLDGTEWHDGQYGVRHYRKVFETAAKYHIMIDNHEPVKPTGLCRTYPNFMTQEGGRGQEYDAWSTDGGNPPSHTCTLPFTRMLAGPFDFTPGTFNFSNPVKPATRVQTTIAKQLALYVIIYSPQQMASDLPENYETNMFAKDTISNENTKHGVPSDLNLKLSTDENNKAFQFIKDVPVDWDTTLVLNAKIGEYVTIARKDRNSENWYIGSITNENARNLEIDLSFLKPNTTYTAQIYSDGEKANWKTNPTDFKIEELNITNKSKLKINLASGGGQAIRLIKK